MVDDTDGSTVESEESRESENRWNATRYDDDHSYVHEYGESVVDLLDARPGERILDIGCGTGHLTAKIADAVGDGGHVVGIDESAEMVDDARSTYPDCTFERVDATEFTADDAFDAVFSNATLHWITDQEGVVERVADVLAPGGRFVAELGGHGNVATVVDATLDECRERGYETRNPWYFPTVGEHAALLERHGLEVRLARLFDRPTELDAEDGLRNWLGMFGDSLLAPLDGDDRAAVLTAVEDSLRDDLFDEESGAWIADYRRLRFVAVRIDEQ